MKGDIEIFHEICGFDGGDEITITEEDIRAAAISNNEHPAYSSGGEPDLVTEDDIQAAIRGLRELQEIEAQAGGPKGGEKKLEKDTVYRGYTIRIGLIGDVFVGKAGTFFYCCKSVEEAKKAIDLLT
jgi:hypothetical protein